MNAMERKKVTSAGIRSIGYDPREQCLEIEFSDGRILQYRRVSSEIHRRLIAAPSILSYFSDHIEDEFSKTQVR
ncbi:MAG: KTSC domain-containing protein [Betaproteobacteria bacterium]|nr:KTSC domain-containing protein [Betaproteobacteria bacterium]